MDKVETPSVSSINPDDWRNEQNLYCGQTTGLSCPNANNVFTPLSPKRFTQIEMGMGSTHAIHIVLLLPDLWHWYNQILIFLELSLASSPFLV